MLFPCFLFSDTSKTVFIGHIKISESILHNPLGNTFQPGKIRMFSSSQFFLEINGRDGLPRVFVDFLLASQTIIVEKARRPCTLTEQDLLFHSWIEFRLVSSCNLHASFSPSNYGSYSSR